MKEEFKAFVRTKPELVSYVSNGEMTWQKFYEIWNLYGNDDKVWEKYKDTGSTVKGTSKEEGFSFSSLVDMVKKVDMDSVQKGVNGMQKVVELLQGLVTGGAASNASKAASGYEPRQLFKKFED